jgi:hypothetical protein
MALSAKATVLEPIVSSSAKNHPVIHILTIVFMNTPLGDVCFLEGWQKKFHHHGMPVHKEIGKN